MSASERGAEAPRAPRADLRMLPLAAAAVTAAVTATSGSGRMVAALIAAGLVACLAAVLRGRWQICAVGAVLAVVSCTGWLRVGQVHDSTAAVLGRQRAAVSLIGRVASDPRALAVAGPRPEGVVVNVTVERVRARGVAVDQRVPILVSASGALGRSAAGLQVGSRVELDGVLAPAEAHDSQAAVLRLRAGPRIIAGPGPLDRAVNRVRAALVASMSHSPGDQRALVPSLVVGDTSAVGERMNQDFRATSLTHLMAVSGANLASTTALLWWVGSWLGMRRRGLQALSVIGVAGFVIVCRSEPSVIRAAAMGIVTMAAVGLSFDRAAGIRSLCVAVLGLMLADPWLCRSVGFWLSVCATAGILWWTTGWARVMSWVPESLARAVVVPWAAQLATQPVITWLSGQVSTTGLLANLAAAPFVGPATALGMTAALLGALWPPLGVLPGWLAGWCVQPIVWIAAAGAAAPAAALSWPARPAPLVVLAGICLGLALATPWFLARPLRALVAGLVVLAAAVVRPPTPGWPGPWQVAVCDVGQGSAALVRVDRASAVVVDTGPEPEPLVECLRDLGVTSVPVIVLSHYHADHVGGLAAALGKGGTRLVLVSPMASPASEAVRVARMARQAGAQVRPTRAGEVLGVGRARLEVLGSGSPAGESDEISPDDGAGGESSAENDSSVVVRAQVGALAVMLTGDAEPAGQARARRGGGDLRADVLVMPHHGSSRQDELFWKRTGARVAVASAGRDNPYGHPAPAALRMAARQGMTVARTDQQGTVVISRADDRVVIRTRR